MTTLDKIVNRQLRKFDREFISKDMYIYKSDAMNFLSTAIRQAVKEVLKKVELEENEDWNKSLVANLVALADKGIIKKRVDWEKRLNKIQCIRMKNEITGEMFYPLSAIEEWFSQELKREREEMGKALWEFLFPNGEWTRPTLRPKEVTQLGIKQAIENYLKGKKHKK